MAKKDIKGLLKESKSALDKEHKDFVKSIGKDLNSFKKKTLAKM